MEITSDKGYESFLSMCRDGKIPEGSEIAVTKTGGGTVVYRVRNDHEVYSLASLTGGPYTDPENVIKSSDTWQVSRLGKEKAPKTPKAEETPPNAHVVKLAVKSGMYHAETSPGHLYSGSLDHIGSQIANCDFPLSEPIVVKPGGVRVRGGKGLQPLKGGQPAEDGDAERLQETIQAARAEQATRTIEASKKAGGKTRPPPPGVRVTFVGGRWY